MDNINPFRDQTLAHAAKLRHDRKKVENPGAMDSRSCFLHFESKPRARVTNPKHVHMDCGGIFRRVSIKPLVEICDKCSKRRGPKETDTICNGCGRRKVPIAKLPKYEYTDHYCDQCSQKTLRSPKRVGEE